MELEQRTPRRFGFCFPCYGCVRASGQRPDLDKGVSPFPLLRDLRAAYTLLPIKSYWFPATAGTRLSAVFASLSHESVHLYLTNTAMGHYTFMLTQLQFLALNQVLLERAGQNARISVPSLKEPSGIVAKAQAALDLVDMPMALLHELMATSLVRFYTENDSLFITSELLRTFLRGLEAGPGIPLAPDLAEHPWYDSWWSDSIGKIWVVRPLPGVARSLAKEARGWATHYDRAFYGYPFRQQYRRLVAAWRKIRSSTEFEEAQRLVLRLSAYPFGMPAQFPGGLRIPSVGAVLDILASYVSRMCQEPLRRLDSLLTVVEQANRVAGAKEWESYLQGALPDFAPVRVTGKLVMDRYIKSIWELGGGGDEVFSQIGEIFSKIWTKSAGYEAGAFVSGIPPVKSEDEFPYGSKFLLAIESVRQVLVAARYSLLGGEGLTFKGPTCLCEAGTEGCWMGGLLGRLWWFTVADPGYEDWFKEHWTKPECVLSFNGVSVHGG